MQGLFEHETVLILLALLACRLGVSVGVNLSNWIVSFNPESPRQWKLPIWLSFFFTTVVVLAFAIAALCAGWIPMLMGSDLIVAQIVFSGSIQLGVLMYYFAVLITSGIALSVDPNWTFFSRGKIVADAAG